MQYAASDLWQMVHVVELTEIMRQQGQNEMINMLNNIRAGNIDEHTENLIKARFVHKNDPSYPDDAVHIFAENAPVNEHNENMLRRLNDTLVYINAIDEIPTAAHLPECDISAARNRKHTETGGLPMKLRLKLEARVSIIKAKLPRYSLNLKMKMLVNVLLH